MKRYIKIGYLLILLLAVVLLAGCGAEISSEILLNDDGSGERIIYAFIDNENISEINGGIEKLDEVLNTAKPSGLEMQKIHEDNGVTYQMKYTFKDIEEYNKKTSELIGEEHIAEFSWEKSLFGLRCMFNEQDVLYELVKWAIDAVEESGIVDNSRSDLYDLKSTTVNIGLDTESFSSGYGDVYYEYEHTYPISRIDINTYVGFDDNVKRELAVVFDKTVVEDVGKDEISKYLNSFYDGFIVEEKDGQVIYKVTLTPQDEEEIKNLMAPVSKETNVLLNIREDENSNLLHKLFYVEENFNLKELTKGTYVIDNVYHILHLPEGYEVDINSSNGYVYDDNMVDGERTIRIKYYEEEDLDLSLTMEKKNYVDNIEVEVDIKNHKLAEKRVSYVFSRDTAENIGLEALEEYFKTINEEIQIIESGSSIIFEDVIDISSNNKENQDHLSKYDSLTYYKKSDISNLKKDVFAFYDNFTFNKILGGLRVNENITYTINIPDKYNVLYLEENGEEIYVERNGEQERKNQQFTFDLGDDNDVEIKLSIEKNSNLLLLITLGVLLVLIVVLIIVFRKHIIKIINKINKQKNSEEQTA